MTPPSAAAVQRRSVSANIRICLHLRRDVADAGLGEMLRARAGSASSP